MAPMKQVDDVDLENDRLTSGVEDTNGDDIMIENIDTSTNFMSIHRRHLLHIAEDGQQNTKHSVPTEKKKNRRSNTDSNSTHSWTTKLQDSVTNTLQSKTKQQWLATMIPMFKWLPSYKWKETLYRDILAGLTVGVMVVPQSMSYAKLAGLPVEFGLYSAFIPTLAYSFFGSSRQLAVGPVALISLLLNTGLTDLLKWTDHSVDEPDYQERYQTLAIQTSLLVGVLYSLMGLLRLGFVTIFLSHAVVSGFTTGAAVIIGMSQVKYIVGYDIANDKALHQLLKNIFSDIDQFNYKTFLMGMTNIAFLLLLKHVGKTKPKLKWVRAIGPLTVTAVTILITWAADLQDIPLVGTIPKGLPALTTNVWSPIEDLGKVMVIVVSITIVGFMESIAIAKQLASKHKYELDSSRELMGLGIANFCGAMFHSYPVTGSFSRSAVNNESGAQSGISGMVTASLVGLVLLLLTSVFEKLPLAVLAAIVISGVIGLLDYEEAMYLWRVHKFDFCVWMTACAGTMFLGVEIGLGIAVGVSLLLVIYESAVPHTAVLGRLPGTTVYRNVKQYPEAERYDGIVMVRIDAPIYFANTQNIREKLQKYEAAAEEQLTKREDSARVKYIILELSPVSHVDTSALHILHDMLRTYKDRGIQLCFSNPSVQVMERFLASGLAEEVGEDHIFVKINDAVNYCLHQMDALAQSVHSEVNGTQSNSSFSVDLEEQAPPVHEETQENP